MSLSFLRPAPRWALFGVIGSFFAVGGAAGGSGRPVSTQMAGTQFRISEAGSPGDVDFDALQPAIAHNTVRNEFLVVWRAETDPGVFEIFASRRSLTGQAIGVPVQLTNDAQVFRFNASPTVVFNPDRDEYLVVWTKRHFPLPFESELSYQILGADGSVLFPRPLTLSTPRQLGRREAQQTEEHAVYNPDDREYLVVWTGEVAPNHFELHAQRIDATTGFATGPNDLVLTQTGQEGEDRRYAASPRVLYNRVEKEYFVVFYANPNPETSFVAIYGLRLNHRLIPIGGPIPISRSDDTAYPDLESFAPDLALNSELNEYLVVWTGRKIGGEYRISGRVVRGPSGGPSGKVLSISAGEPFQRGLDALFPRVSIGDDGYLVAWEEENSIEDKFEIHGQWIQRVLGTEAGVGDFQISRTAPDASPNRDAFSAAVAYSRASGSFLVAWTANVEAEDEFEVFGSLIPSAAPRADPSFAPQIAVDIRSAGGSPTLSGGQNAFIQRTSTIFLDQPELPRSRVLRLDKGFLNLEGLSVGAVPIETSAELRATLGGQTMSIASAKIRYVVYEVSGSEARLRGVITEMTASPVVLALVPREFNNIAQDLVGYRLVEARILSDPLGGGFVLEETFDTASKVSSDYQGFGATLTTNDTFDSAFFRAFPSQHVLTATSDFFSARAGLSAGAFTSESQVSGAAAPSVIADPNPIQVCSGQVGRTTIRWSASGGVQVRLDSPDGSLFASGAGSGQAQTGDWVHDGMVFFLVASDTGDVLARVKALHTTEGCPLPDRFSFAQFGDGEGLSSQILLLADSSVAQTPAELRFNDPAGEPLEPDLGGQGVDGAIRVSVPPGGMIRLSTDGAGPLIRGSVRVASGLDLTGVLLFNGPFGFAGVGANTSSSDGFLSPVQTDPSGINTGLAISNMEASPVLLHLTLRDSTGTVASSQLSLDGLGQEALFVDELAWEPPVDLTHFVGTIEVQPGPRVAALSIQARAGEFATLPTSSLLPATPAGQVPGDNLFFAHFADGLGRIFTQILLLNPGTVTASANVVLRDISGAPAQLTLNGEAVDGGLEVRVPPKGLLILESDSFSDPLVQGSVEVISDRPLGGAVLFGGEEGVAGVASGSPVGVFSSPVILSAAENQDMGVAVANATDLPAQLQLILKDPNGAVVATSSDNLPPRGQFARFVTQFRWSPEIDLSNFEGVLEAHSDRRVVATTLLTRPRQLATLPVAAREDTEGPSAQQQIHP